MYFKIKVEDTPEVLNTQMKKLSHFHLTHLLWGGVTLF